MPKMPVENGKLHAEIEKLPKLPAEIAGNAESAEIGEIADQDFRTCNGERRLTMQRLPRLPELQRMPILPKSETD